MEVLTQASLRTAIIKRSDLLVFLKTGASSWSITIMRDGKTLIKPDGQPYIWKLRLNCSHSTEYAGIGNRLCPLRKTLRAEDVARYCASRYSLKSVITGQIRNREHAQEIRFKMV
jgi:hypothetical protein